MVLLHRLVFCYYFYRTVLDQLRALNLRGPPHWPIGTQRPLIVLSRPRPLESNLRYPPLNPIWDAMCGWDTELLHLPKIQPHLAQGLGDAYPLIFSSLHSPLSH